MIRQLLFVLALFTFVSASSAQVSRFDHFARESTGTFTSTTNTGHHLSGTAKIHLESYSDSMKVTIVANATSGQTWRTIAFFAPGSSNAQCHILHSIPFHPHSPYSSGTYYTTSSGFHGGLKGDGDFSAGLSFELGGNILVVRLNGHDTHNRPFRFVFVEG